MSVTNHAERKHCADGMFALTVWTDADPDSSRATINLDVDLIRRTELGRVVEYRDAAGIDVGPEVAREIAAALLAAAELVEQHKERP